MRLPVAFIVGVLVATLILPVGSADVAGRAQALRALQASVSLGMWSGSSPPSFFVGCGGVIVGNTRVLTAFHCVRGPGESGKIVVRPYADQSLLIKTRLGWYRAGIDLAVLETEQPLPGRIAEIASDVAVGERILVVGAPDGDEFVVTAGIVGKIVIDRWGNCGENDPLGTENHQILYTDAMIFFGNSGGGMFNDAGQLVGISERVAVTAGECGVPYAGEHLLFGFFVGPDELRKAAKP